MLQVAVVTMVRNAIDLLDDFLAHHLAIVDRIHVVDHLSDDGTYELLIARSREDDRIVVATHDFEQIFQGAVVTALAKQAVAHGADWVLPLDVDEFLPHRSAEELRTALSDAGSPLVELEWLNCVSQEVPEALRPIDWTAPFLSLPDEPSSSKIGVARDLVARRDFRVGHGSHGIELRHGQAPEPRRIGRLLHFPIRSVAQARAKFEYGAHSYQAMHPHKLKRTKHWFVYGELLESGLSAAEVQSLALRYPQKDVVQVVDRAERISFRPNDRFLDRPELVTVSVRRPRQSPLTQREVGAVIRDGEVVLLAVPFWRTRRLLRAAGSLAVRLRGWVARRLGSA